MIYLEYFIFYLEDWSAKNPNPTSAEINLSKQKKVLTMGSTLSLNIPPLCLRSRATVPTIKEFIGAFLVKELRSGTSLFHCGSSNSLSAGRHHLPRPPTISSKRNTYMFARILDCAVQP